MSRVVIEKERCKSCELCVNYCPQDCLSIGDRINPSGYLYVVYDGDECKGCGLCAEMCPDVAIQVYKSKKKESKNDD